MRLPRRRPAGRSQCAHANICCGQQWEGRSTVGVGVNTGTPAQREFVTEVSRYLLLCHYEGVWQPLAVYRDEEVIGFLMWAVDPADGSAWLGGILIDQAQQGRGYGRAAVRAALDLLVGAYGHNHFALSYNPANAVAQSLYAALGFVATDEQVDDEVVARLHLADG